MIPCEKLATKIELDSVKEEVETLKAAINGMFGEAEDGNGQIRTLAKVFNGIIKGYLVLISTD